VNETFKYIPNFNLSEIDKNIDFCNVFNFKELNINKYKVDTFIYPLLIAKSNDKYILVDGWKRYDAFIKNDIKNANALLYENPHVKIDLFKYKIKLQLDKITLSSNFTIVEIANIIATLKNYFNMSDKNLQEIYLDIFSENISIYLINQYYKINSLDKIFLDFLYEHKVNLKLAYDLSSLDDELLSICSLLIKKTNLTHSKLRNLITYLKIIKINNNIIYKSLMDNNDIKNIIDDEDTNPNQKWDLIENYFKNICYPEYISINNRFISVVNNLQINKKNIDFIAPKHFEGEFLNINLKIKNYNDFKDIIDNISKLNENDIKNLTDWD